MSTPSEEQQNQKILENWLQAHQPRIDAAVLDALEEIDGVSDALTTLGADDDQIIAEKINGALALAAQGALPETMKAQFDVVFADKSDQLRKALGDQAELICREQLSTYVEYLIQRARERQTQQ